MTLDGQSEAFHLSHRRFTLNAQQPSPLPLQAAHARDEPAGGRDLEEGDPRHQPRAQQLARAAVVARALRQARRRAIRRARSSSSSSRRSRSARLHLKRFIEGYARFAKLPRPQAGARRTGRPSRVAARDDRASSFRGPCRRSRATSIAGQLEQVLINLLKNAHESGSAPDEVQLAIESGARGHAHARPRSRQRHVAAGARECAAAVLFDEAQRHRSRAAAQPRDRRGARRAAESSRTAPAADWR